MLIGEELEDAFMLKVLNALDIEVDKEVKKFATPSLSLWLSFLGNNSLNKHVPDGMEERAVNILNPLSNELAVMRQSMLFGVLEVLAYNQNRQNPNLSLYEFGNTYQKIEEGKYQESSRLSIVLTGQLNDPSWHGPKESSFYEIKSHVEGILKKMGLTPKAETGDLNFFSDGIEYRLGRNVLAKLGVVKSELSSQFGVKAPVFYAELDWDHIFNFYKTTIKYKPIAKFPAVRRDLSLLIDQSVSFKDISDLLRSVDRNILKEVDLFDVYEGKNLPDGKKSYAINLLIQDENKTLTDKIVDKLMDKLIGKLKEELGAELR